MRQYGPLLKATLNYLAFIASKCGGHHPRLTEDDEVVGVKEADIVEVVCCPFLFGVPRRSGVGLTVRRELLWRLSASPQSFGIG